MNFFGCLVLRVVPKIMCFCGSLVPPLTSRGVLRNHICLWYVIQIDFSSHPGPNINRIQIDIYRTTKILLRNFVYFEAYPRRCKTSSVGQSAGLSIPMSLVRFRQKFQKPKSQIYMYLSSIDPQARILNTVSRNKSNNQSIPRALILDFQCLFLVSRKR